MSLKTRIAAVAVALAAASAGAATAGPASAATPSCGPTCVDVFSLDFGTHHTPANVLDVYRQGEKVGQPIILFRTANYDPAEDFTAAFQGTVADFYAAGLVSSAVALHYGCVQGDGTKEFPSCTGSLNDWAFELEYAPYGVDSGLCVGLASTAVSGEGVTLQGCGTSSTTVWITDIADKTGRSFFSTYLPLINGSDSNFSQPFVLTYPAGANPVDKPRAQLTVRNLTGFQGANGTPDGSISSNQMWGADFGPLK